MEKNTVKKFQVRTDLAIEAREIIDKRNKQEQVEIDGVEVETRQEEAYTLTHVKITDEDGSTQMGKPMGSYITIESPYLKENSVEERETLIQVVAEELKKLLAPISIQSVLIIGLGNWNVTPDALGPMVVSRVLVTRHLKETLPSEMQEKVAPVAAVSPGVMGLTGIETGEIVKGIVEQTQPSVLIAIDALAARKTSRINATIQMSDTGVAPGSGVGNHRMRLDQDSLGIPVIALGVPTVVDAATLVNDTMNHILGGMLAQAEEGAEFYTMLSELEDQDKYTMITELLDPYTENLFVTPKEVDAVMERLADIVANALNIALHPVITIADIKRFS